MPTTIMRKSDLMKPLARTRRRGRPKAVDATDTKRRILDTAFLLFYRHGIGAVSVDAIIDAANVSKAGLYYHFSSKEQLAAEVLRQHSHRVLENVRTHLSGNPSPGLGDLADMVARYIANPERRGDLFVNTVVEGLPSKAFRDICREHQRQLIECIRNCISPALSPAIAGQALLIVYGMIVRDQIDADECLIEQGYSLLHDLARRTDA